jgi:phage terminase small subunit
MGEIQNSRHERFAQELAAGKTADAAYEAAGYQKHRGNAARLSANERVKKRVGEIQAIGAERAAITVQSLIEEAEHARIKAMESQNGAAAAVSAITAKAKLAGLWREKVDQHSTGTISTVWQVSWEDEEDGGNPDG